MPTLGEALERLVAGVRARPALIGVAGPQGAGKSTLLADFIVRAGDGVAGFSLDDFYLSGAARSALARDVHPLFATRGVPGTHDVVALNATLDALTRAGDGDAGAIRAFDKLADEPLPAAQWPVFRGRPRLIVVEGWCLGATPQNAEALAAPINALEAGEDAQGVWRSAVNAQLAGAYAALFARFDAILLLAAPSFDIVLDWRCQQQESLIGRALTGAERAAMARFVAHFERISRSMLAGGVRAEITLQLDAARRVMAVSP
jgi:D-glycerate 3-kinase